MPPTPSARFLSVTTRLPKNIPLSRPRSHFLPRHFQARNISATARLKMPEALDPKEVNSETDPSVAKQYDNETPKADQWKELYELIDGKKISILSTYRQGLGPVGRSMAIAKRSGPDILYLANKHSKKFQDLEKNKEVQITFQDSKTQDWISISGTATTTSQ